MRILVPSLVLLSACSGDSEPDKGNCDTPQVFYGDADGDGFGDADAAIAACSAPAGAVADNTDCDDSDPESPRSVRL